VSDCISNAPEGWIDQWRHNELWAYDTCELAWSVVPADERREFDPYAYRLYPVRFVHGQQEQFDLPPLAVEPLSNSFVRLGYDAVSRSVGSTFECSPLSCNYIAREVQVSRYCLVDSESEALRLGREFSLSEPEPGPYHVLEVWRQRDGTT
jgi:hypothetical protein